MDMTGERRIPAPKMRVWEALNDPKILQASIPGCKSLEKVRDDVFRATSAVSVGPVSATFTGNIKLLDQDPPNAYRIEGTGRGGQAGFAKGGAHVTLTEEEGQTILSYTAKAEISGKLAQLGSRLIDSTAKQMADQFFDRFSAALAPAEEAAPATHAAENGNAAPAEMAAAAQPPIPVEDPGPAEPPPQRVHTEHQAHTILRHPEVMEPKVLETTQETATPAAAAGPAAGKTLVEIVRGMPRPYLVGFAACAVILFEMFSAYF
jgi:carbon monoxide dehydrogenase subunit G